MAFFFKLGDDTGLPPRRGHDGRSLVSEGQPYTAEDLFVLIIGCKVLSFDIQV